MTKKLQFRTTLCAIMTFAVAFGGMGYLFAVTPPSPSKQQRDKIAKWKAQIRKAIARLDKLEPNWRLKDLLASRKNIPDEKNGALIVQQAFEKLPKDWDKWTWGRAYSDFPPPPVLLLQNKRYLETKENLQNLRPAVSLARKLADYPNGRFRFEFAEQYFATKSTNPQMARAIAKLLEFDSHILLQEKRYEDAAKLCLGIFHIGRAIGDEPHLPSQLVRRAISFIGKAQLERCLGQGFEDTRLLERFQDLLRTECEHSLVWSSLHPEIAGALDLLTKLETGRIKWPELQKDIFKSPLMEKYTGDFYSDGMVHKYKAFLLGFLADILKTRKDNPKLALDELNRYVKPITTDIEKKPKKVYFDAIFEIIPYLIDGERRTHANSRCGHSAIAAERFRIANKRWPGSLSELVRKGYLKELPIDPFSGRKLRFRKTNDGLVIYSVGTGNPGLALGKLPYRGNMYDNPYKPVHYSPRLEFRLWSPDKRRQPAPPPRKQEPNILDFPPGGIPPELPPVQAPANGVIGGKTRPIDGLR